MPVVLVVPLVPVVPAVLVIPVVPMVPVVPVVPVIIFDRYHRNHMNHRNPRNLMNKVSNSPFFLYRFVIYILWEDFFHYFRSIVGGSIYYYLKWQEDIYSNCLEINKL